MKAQLYAPSREVHEGFGRRTEAKNSSLLHCSRYCHCGGDPIHHFSIARTLTSQISVRIRKRPNSPTGNWSCKGERSGTGYVPGLLTLERPCLVGMALLLEMIFT